MNDTIDLFNSFRRYCTDNSLISPGDTVVVAVSGGADSTALLDLLHRWRENEPGLRLHITHFNHRLRPEADEEQQFVEELGERLEVPFTTKSVDVKGWSEEHGESIHAAARKLRYEFFNETAVILEGESEGLVKIATGHHLNDQAETFLLRAISGAGIEGLAGIRKSLVWQDGVTVIRPMLGFSRKQIEDYCSSRDLEYVEDASNLDPAYPRSLIRQGIIPQIENIFSNRSIVNIGRTAELLSEFADYFDSEVESAYRRGSKRTLLKGIALDYHIYISYLTVLRTAVLQRAFRQIAGEGHRVSRDRLIAADNHIMKLGSGVIELGSNVVIEQHSGTVHIWRCESWNQQLLLSEDDSVEIPGLGYLSAEKLSAEEISLPPPRDSQYCDQDFIGPGPYIIRPACPGDRIRPLKGDTDQKVSDILRENKIPPGRRRYPVIMCGESIAVVPPFRIADQVRLTSSTRHVVRFTLTNDDNPVRQDKET